jgi:hypothetical protein
VSTIRPMRVLTHIKKLDDCFGQFLVRVICDGGASREIEPEALARLVGWSVPLKELALRNALLEVREEGGRGGGGCEAQTAEALSIEIIRHAFPVN